MTTSTKTQSNGISKDTSDEQAVLAFMREVKAGKADAIPPEVHDSELEQAILVTLQINEQAKGNTDLLDTIYHGLALAEGTRRKKLHPLFAELLREEVEKTPAGTLYSEIERKEIRWQWKGRTAFGKLTTFDGNPGEGKSSILCDIAAKYSQGQPMPGEEAALCPAGGVVLVMIEDDPSDTIIHRLERAGADLSRISHLAEIPAGEVAGIPITRSFNLHLDLPLLIREIERIHAGLVILDPLAGLIGKTSTNDSAEMYGVLDPLAAVARALDVAVIFTRHLNKQQAEHSLYRGAGTMAIIGRARFGLIVGKDPEDETISVLANHKNNPVRKAPSLSYQITSDEEQGDPRSYVLWKGINKHSSQQLFEGGKKATIGANRLEIIQLLRMNTEALSPDEIWQALALENPDLEYTNVRMTLSRMKTDGQVISPSRGKYTVEHPVTTVTSVTSDDELALEVLL